MGELRGVALREAHVLAIDEYVDLIPFALQFAEATGGARIQASFAANLVGFPFQIPHSKSPKQWCWEVHIRPMGRFALDALGVLRGASRAGWFENEPELRRRVFEEGLEEGDIHAIVKEYLRL
jgi:hypothetical protein